MENKIIELSDNGISKLEAAEFKTLINKYFNETEAVKIDLITNTITKYPCSIVTIYNFLYGIVDSMPEFTSLKSVLAMLASFSWYDMGDDFKIQLMKKNFEMLNSL